MGKHETNHENSPIKNDEDFIWPNYHKDCSEIFGVFLGSKYGTDLVQCHTGYNTGRMTTWVPNGSVNNRYTWRRWPSRWNWRNIWWVFLLLGKKSCLASKKFGTQGQEYITGSLTKKNSNNCSTTINFWGCLKVDLPFLQRFQKKTDVQNPCLVSGLVILVTWVLSELNDEASFNQSGAYRLHIALGAGSSNQLVGEGYLDMMNPMGGYKL